MSRGGFRAGAGRPKLGEPTFAQEIATEATKGGVTPLEYMLAIINDPDADQSRRDRMAQAAAPYVHPKAGEAGPQGKKAERAEHAKVAQQGTEWETLLDGPSVN